MKLNRNEKYVKWGLTAFLVIVAAGLFWLVFSNLRGFYDLIVEFLNIIAALLYGCLFAYLMNPVMKVTQRIMDKLLAKRNLSDRMAARISKITGICAAVLVFCLAVYALIALIVPNLIASIEELLQPEKLESYYATISKWFRGIFTNSDIQSFLEKTVGDPLEMVIGWLKKLDYSVIVTSLTSSVYSVVMVIFNILLGIVAAVYILIFKEELFAQAKKVTVRSSVASMPIACWSWPAGRTVSSAAMLWARSSTPCSSASSPISACCSWACPMRRSSARSSA